MRWVTRVRSAPRAAALQPRTSDTFGFSIIRPADETEIGRGIRDRYDEAAALALGAFSRLGVKAEVGEVREEFWPVTTASGSGREKVA